MRTNSAAEVQAVAAEARTEGAREVEVARDGRPISEMDLARLAAAVMTGSTMSKLA